jgi:uncharacterized protein (DUF3084 family)
MPREDRERSRRLLKRELRSCGFTEEEASKKVSLEFSDGHITSLDLYRVREILSEVRHKFEATNDALKAALETERDALKAALETERRSRQELVNQIRRLIERDHLEANPKLRRLEDFSRDELATMLDRLIKRVGTDNT